MKPLLTLYGCRKGEITPNIGGTRFFDTRDEATKWCSENNVPDFSISKVTILDSFEGKTEVIMVETNGRKEYFRLAITGFEYYDKDKSIWKHTPGGYGRAQRIYKACKMRGVNILNSSTHTLLLCDGVVYAWSPEAEAYLSEKANAGIFENRGYVCIVEYYPELGENEEVLGVTLDVYPEGGTYYCQSNLWGIVQIVGESTRLPFKRSSVVDAKSLEKCYDVLYGRKDCIHIEGEQPVLRPLSNPVEIKDKKKGTIRRIFQPSKDK